MMKKITLLFTMLFLTAFSWQGMAQVSIGDGTATNRNLPIEPYYGYSYSQVIYLQSEIYVAGDITTLTWDFAGSSIDNSNDWTIYIGHTTKTEFTSNTDWIPLSSMTQVFSGTVSVDANNKVVVDITDFTYNNTDNLVIAVDENASSYNGSSDDFNCSAVSNDRAIEYHGDSTNPDPASPPTGTRKAYIANIILGGITQTCPAPSGLSVNNVTDTQADLSWTAGGGESQWNIEYGATGFTLGQGTIVNGVTNPYTLTGLSSNTDYDYYVQADCGSGDTSVWVGPYTFTTDCPVYTPDYTEDFSSFVPTCWDEASNGDETTGPQDIGSGSWISSSSLGSGSAKINLYNTSHSDWILSPEFDLSAGGYEVVVDVAVTNYNSANPDAMGSDDKVQLLYTEDGSTWTNITTWTANDNIPNSPTAYSFPLSSTATNVQFGILATDGPTDDTEDYDFHIDKFIVRTPPSCLEPSNLTNTDITDVFAHFDWTENGSATTWNVEVKAGADFTPGNGEADYTTTVTTHPFAFGFDLTPSTTYYWYVRADCGGGDTSAWVGSSFATLATPPANDECSNAIALEVNTDLNCTSVTAGTLSGATASGVDESACLGTENDDVWFSFVATASSHRITLSDVTGSPTDLYHSLWEGSCGSLTLVSGSCSDGNTSNPSGLVSGNTYYLRVNSYSSGSGATTNFNVCVGTPPPPPANDDFAGAIPITPSSEGTGCSSYNFQAWLADTSVTDSGMDGSCDGTHTGLDVFYSWTATTPYLVWNDGAGNPGIVIRDTAGNEITCSSTYASDDTILSGWSVGDDLIIQIYDYDTANVDVSFCLERKSVVNPMATYTAVGDCDNAQFNVSVDVTDLGGASSVTVADDQGSATQQTSSTGVLTFGPYSDGTTVNFTVTNDQDNAYSTSGSVSFSCPPANDACADATPVYTLPYSITQDASDATNNDGPISDCAGGMNDGVWYTFTVSTAGEITVSADPTGWDPELAVYSGSCGAFTCVDSADDGLGGDPETVTFTATAGTQYWVNIGDFSASSDGSEGPFDLNITTSDGAVLGIANNIIEGFNMFPNPVTDMLNLTAQDAIDSVSIYNMLGQKVLQNTPGATQIQLDMSSLPTGAYIVKVQVGAHVGSYNLIKQ